MKTTQSHQYQLLISRSIFILIILLLAALIAYQPRTALIGLIGIAAIVSVVVKPYWIVYLFVGSFPFVALIPRGTYLPVFKVDETLIILGFIAWAVSPNSSKKLRITKIDLLFWGLILAGSILPFIGQLLRGWETEWLEIIALLKGYLIYRLILQTMTTQKQQQKIIYLLLIPFSFVLLIAILQMLNVGSTRSLLAEIYAGSGIYVQSADTALRYFRATSTLANWNTLGSYATLGALLSLALLIHARRKINIYLLVITIAACVGLLILSGSSSSIVGLLVGGAVFWYYNSKRIKLSKLVVYLAPVALLVLVVFFAAGKQVLQIQIERQTGSDLLYFQPTGTYVSTHGLPASVAIRGYLAQYLLGVMNADGIALITGFGEGVKARELLSWTTAESGYMSMLFYYGPLYIIFYFLLMLQILIQARKIRKRLSYEFPVEIGLTYAVICATVSMVVMNIISSYYTAAGTSHFFWILVACMMAIIPILTALGSNSQPATSSP